MEAGLLERICTAEREAHELAGLLPTSARRISSPSKDELSHKTDLLVKRVRGEHLKLQLFASACYILLLFLLILATLPVHDLATSVKGVRSFVTHGVTFEKLDGSEGTLESVANLDDAFLYSQALTHSLMEGTVKGYAGRRPPLERLKLLRVHRLINTLVWKQRRVAPTDCAYPAFRKVYGPCYEDLDTHEVTSDKYTLKNGMVVPYSSEMNGFGVEIPYDADIANGILRKLRDGQFLDLATREFSVIFMFHNSPGHFTGVSEVMFDLSEYGAVSPAVVTEFLRMMPYSKETNGTMLIVLQASVLFAMIIRIGIFAYEVQLLPHKRWIVAKFLSPWTLLEIVNVAVLAYVIASWISFLRDPARLSFDISADHYQDILHLAKAFTDLEFWMAFAMLISTVRMLEYFTALDIERATKVTHLLEAVLMNLASFVLVFFFVFVGFSLSFHVLLGAHVELFASVAGSVRTLFLWFAALGEGQREVMDEPGGDIFMVLFILFCMVILFNMFIAVVMAAHDEVMGREGPHKPPNFEIADWICDKLGIPPFIDDPFLLLDCAPGAFGGGGDVPIGPHTSIHNKAESSSYGTT